jgi:3-phenylpropionate/trans-cinnamate dioxygenase ferredoxin reductase subunit
MKTYKYLIIGGGMTGDAAARGIRQVDRKGTIGMISDESDAPYNRPPLTKGLWKGKALGSIWRKTKNKGVKLHLGCTVKKINLKQKRVVDDQGTIFRYEKLLLATGGRPKLLPFGEDEIIYYRTLSDYRRLRALTGKDQRFAVIGGGFVGSEIAAGLAMNGKKVVIIFPGKSIGAHIFPPGLSRFVSKYYRHKGVDLLPRTKLLGLKVNGNKQVLKLSGNREITVDGVLAGLGIEPNVEIAKKARLKVADGVVVNDLRVPAMPTFKQLATWPLFTIPRWQSVSASNTRTMPTAWAWQQEETWRANPSLILICRFFTPTCSIWATKPSAR